VAWRACFRSHGPLKLAAYTIGAMVLQEVPGNWRWMVAAPIVPGLVLALAPLFLSESPRWLVMKGNLEKALAVLHNIHQVS
jgi:hypothetical protein